jgi:hypothetical protein
VSQSLRQRRELHAVAQIGKAPPARLVDGMPWTDKNNAASHNTSDQFLARQIARGLQPRERKP